MTSHPFANIITQEDTNSIVSARRLEELLFEQQQQQRQRHSNSSNNNMAVHHHHPHDLAMNRMIGLKNNMPPSPRVVHEAQLRATPTMTNRSSVRIVEPPSSPPVPNSSNSSLLSKKKAFLMHALGQIETEINRMRHAQKTAHDLEAALRTRRIALIEQEMEMHERRCDYLEVMRKYSGGNSPPVVSGNVSPSPPHHHHSNNKDNNETTKNGGKRSLQCDGDDNKEELGRSPNKKLKLECSPPPFGRMQPGRFLPGPQGTLWMPRMPESTSAAVAAVGNSHNTPTLEQSSLTLLSEMAMRLMGSTSAVGGSGGQRGGPTNAATAAAAAVSPPRRLHPRMMQQMNAMGYPPGYPRLDSSSP